MQAFCEVRSERELPEQLDYNLTFRWFVGLLMDAPVWDASTFSKTRDRLVAGDAAQSLLAAVSAQPRVQAPMSDEHFSVDGTPIQAWSSHRSFVPKAGSDVDPPVPTGDVGIEGRNADRDWRGQTRSDETHASTTDPDARLARKSDGQASNLAYAGHMLMENRSDLVSGVCLTRASGTAEREAALTLVDRRRRTGRITLGADKGYDVAGFISALRGRKVTPHVAIDRRVSKLGTVRRTAVDRRTTRHPGYAASQRTRKRIEKVFGWIKSSAGLRQTKFRGVDRVGWSFDLAATAYNLVRLPRLLRQPA